MQKILKFKLYNKKRFVVGRNRKSLVDNLEKDIMSKKYDK